jgi:hypothetical protein
MSDACNIIQLTKEGRKNQRVVREYVKLLEYD